jgi:hypothetical protein
MKLNTAAVLRVAMPLLSASRKVRDMVEQLLIEKRMLEDAVKAKSGETVE